MNFVRRHRILAGVLAVLVIIALVYSFFGRSEEKPELALSEVIESARQGRVAEIVVSGNRLTVTMKNGEEYRSRKEHEVSIIETLENSGVDVGGQEGIRVEVDSGGFGNWLGIAISFLPLLIFAGVMIFFASRVFGGRKTE